MIPFSDSSYKWCLHLMSAAGSEPLPLKGGGPLLGLASLEVRDALHERALGRLRVADGRWAELALQISSNSNSQFRTFDFKQYSLLLSLPQRQIIAFLPPCILSTRLRTPLQGRRWVSKRTMRSTSKILEKGTHGKN